MHRIVLESVQQSNIDTRQFQIHKIIKGCENLIQCVMTAAIESKCFCCHSILLNDMIKKNDTSRKHFEL